MFEIDFETNSMIDKFEKLERDEIEVNNLNLSKRDIRWILLSLKAIHCWEELLDDDLGLRD